MIRVLELFAGIGACSKALTNLGIEHEIVDAVEIDKYAIKSFNAIHGTNFEPQDITTWNKDIECDIIMHGSPCQDFSVAGKQAGGDKGSGTRSSLMYETLRIVEKLKPKYVIWENVKNLLSKKHRHNFDAYIEAMSNLGYVSKYQVLNAKDYGVPQNRERVFTVSCRHDGDSAIAGSFLRDYKFPEKQELTVRLKDVLDDEVDEKYYLSDEQTKRLKMNKNIDVAKPVRTGGRGSVDRHSWDIVAEPTPLQRKVCNEAIARGLVEPNDAIEYTYSNARLKEIRGGYIKKQNMKDNNVMSTLKCNPQQIGVCVDGVAIRTANSKGYDMAQDGDGIDLGYPQSATRRGRVGHGVAKTIPTGDSQGTLDGMRIRKLTPRECWRLMGFDDADFDKAQAAGISNTQLYKQAGNSIVVNCLEAIFNGIEWSDNG